MSPDRRGYLYRSERSGNSVRRVYVGKASLVVAEVLALGAEIDALARQERCERRAQDRQDDEEYLAFDELVELITAAALLASGYREHRGQWRKKRAQR